MIVGIAYHSPLDVVALFPIEIKYSLFPDDEVDVLISDNVIRVFKARVQLVFTSARNLVKENLPIIDQGLFKMQIFTLGLHGHFVDKLMRALFT